MPNPKHRHSQTRPDLRRQRRSATSDAGCLEPADRQSEGVTLGAGGHER